MLTHMQLDRCRGLDPSVCSLEKLMTVNSKQLQIGGYIQIGADSMAQLRSFDGCLDEVFFQNHLLDFYAATRERPSIRGCPNAEQGCMRGGRKICGEHGICQNSLRMTDMLTCLCEPGYKPNVTQSMFPHRWPCDQASTAWSTTNAGYNARFLNMVPSRLRLSVRTRHLNFQVFVAASWRLYLTIKNGVPTLQFRNKMITLDKLNVSDGNWHLFDTTFTPSYVEIQVDEFDNDFYKAARMDYQALPQGVADFVIAKDAQGTCIDDAWVDFVNTWKNTEHDYPLEIIKQPKYARRIDWDVDGRTNSCSEGTKVCSAPGNQNLCHPSAVCVDEWRGYRCQCPSNMTLNASGICQYAHCVPNPCVHGVCTPSTQASSTKNFTCQCFPGWNGTLCNQSTSSAGAGLAWWWILLIVLLIILLIILIALLVWCCCCREKTDASEPSVVQDDEHLGRDGQVHETWEHGEKDYMGHINYSALNGATETRVHSFGQTRSDMRMELSPETAESDNRIYLPRDYGQKTSVIPPWERFELEDSADINLDQALEYGYEGFDGRPPPEFRPDEPFEIERIQ